MVGQTLEFSLLNKTKKREKEEIPVIVSALLRMFGIEHTRHTLVGDGKLSLPFLSLNFLRRSAKAYMMASIHPRRIRRRAETSKSNSSPSQRIKFASTSGPPQYSSITNRAPWRSTSMALIAFAIPEAFSALDTPSDRHPLPGLTLTGDFSPR